MGLIPLKDILISARQESNRMRHHFIGVEHLFVALLEIKHGIASIVLNEYGYTHEYIIDLVRRKAGKGSQQRLWAGFPTTPRADVVLGIAQELAQEDPHDINERDMFIAILDEADNTATRVLDAIGVDLEELRERITTLEPKASSAPTFLKIEMAADFEGNLSNDEVFVLRRMFHGYSSLRVETSLTGGYTSARLLVVTPIKVGEIEAASVVVKIGLNDTILDEAQRYNKYVKDTLPPLTARLEDRPVAPEGFHLAGLKYTLLTDSEGNPTDMRAVANGWAGQKLGAWLEQRLYGQFGEKWWKQTRPYRFEAWREYDWMLPPILTLQISEDTSVAPNKVLRFPIRRSTITHLDLGEVVSIENFIIYKVDPERGSLRLALAQGEDTARAYQIEVRGIDFEKNTYFRGEVVDRLVGTVWKTRDDELMAALQELEPNFDVTGENVVINSVTMPNPVKFYRLLLDAMVNGTISTIHGDLHLGNILIGPRDSALLIDFARTRDGHAIFDWANLEVSLMSELIIPKVGETWEDVQMLMGYLAVVDEPELYDLVPEDIAGSLAVITSLREIVGESLAEADKWHEYSLSLAFTALRAMTWKTMSIASRRTMYLVSAVAMHHFSQRDGASDSDRTPSPDSTDFWFD